MKMVNVRFNENSVYATRSYGFGEEHVISEEDANALGDSVTVLGDAPNDFPRYEKSVYGDNEDAKKREPHDPAEVDPTTVGEEIETRDEVAPENKMVTTAPERKSKK